MFKFHPLLYHAPNSLIGQSPSSFHSNFLILSGTVHTLIAVGHVQEQVLLVVFLKYTWTQKALPHQKYKLMPVLIADLKTFF